MNNHSASSCPHDESISASRVHAVIDECVLKNNNNHHSDSDNSPNPRTRLRRAREEDIPNILQLVRDLAKYEKSPEDVVQITLPIYLRDGFKQGEETTTSPPLFYCILVEAETTNNNNNASWVIVGQALWYLPYSTWLGPFQYLEQLYVQEKYRSHGIGLRLMHTIADIGQSLGCKRFEWLVLDWNKSARDFYNNKLAKVQTLEGYLTVRLDKEGIQTFLSSRGSTISNSEEAQSNNASSSSSSSLATAEEVPLSKAYIHKVVDDCVERNNQFLMKSSKGKLRIRRAQKDDAATILTLVQSLADYVNESDEVHGTREMYMRDGFDDHHYPLFHCLLLEEIVDPNDESSATIPQGIATWYIGYSARGGRFVFLDDLFVQEKVRSLGGGKMFLYTLADIAATWNCTRLEWRTLEWNTAARTFYEQRVGAKILEECITMRLDESGMAQFVGSQTKK